MKFSHPAFIAVCALSLSLGNSSCTSQAVTGPSNLSVAVNDAPGEPGAEVFDPSKLDRQPVPVFQVRPNYPLKMRKAGISGQAVVGFIVDQYGQVLDPHVVSATSGEFADAAIVSIAQWRFRPGQRNGHPVNTRLEVPINFAVKSD